MSLNVLALTSGNSTPSARFRIRQYIDKLDQYGINVDECIPSVEVGNPDIKLPDGARVRNYPQCWPKLVRHVANGVMSRALSLQKINSADCVWLERGLMPGLLTFERIINRPIFYDVDDAVWLIWPRGRAQVEYIAKRAEKIIAGNDYIANFLEKYNKNICVVPTAVDGSAYRMRKKLDATFRIGWTGTSSNFDFLYEIEPAIKEMVVRHPNIKIKIIADKEPRFDKIPSINVEFVRWSPDIEATELNTFSVGIMPLKDNEWTRGKCSFKLVQYMASGIPTIASPVGANLTLNSYDTYGRYASTLEEWIEALEYFYNNEAERDAKGIVARNVFERNYSTNVTSKKLSKIFLGM